MSDNPEREKEIFGAALDFGSLEEQRAFLMEACGSDESLRRSVEALLEANSQNRGFIPDRVPDPRDSPGNPPSGACPGDVIGRYKLLQQIGEGGWGLVFMAEQEDPVRRKVALKLIKPGMDTRSVMARFEAERQALALMDHPNIAKVLDAGATASGRPYFVMELVRGMKITDYCDEAKLFIRARLDLFIQVCQAVQHAHQKGIIHRDLKPSNILVTVNDGVAVPKVIDFGIAKATGGQRLTDKTIFTAFEQFIGTPAYMSPEQAELTSLDIDTRSDIYALGVLFYEMLTGKTPFDSKDLLAAGLDGMRRTIREKEPDRPSSRLSTMPGNELGTTAHRRGIAAPKLVSELQGDLDWIAMKALEKQRERRYQSAAELAADVRRHLENDPVEARPPSQIYRIKKWAKKNRLAVASVTAVVAAIVLGLVVSAWQWGVARANAKKARTEAARSTQVAGFLEAMLKGVNPSVAKGQDTRLLRQILDETTRRLDRELKEQPDVEADLRSVVGNVYVGLGDFSNAAAMYGKALALRTNLFGSMDVKVADSLSDLGDVAWHQGHYPEAEQLETQALQIRTNLLGGENPAVAASLDALGKINWHAGRWPEAETLLRRSLTMRRKLLGDKHADTVVSLDDLAGLLSQEDKFAEAESMQREALALNKQLLGSEDPAVGVSLNNLSDTLDAEGKLEEAESVGQEALALREKILGRDHPDYAYSLFELGNVLRDEGKLPGAESDYREALGIRRHVFGETNLDVAGSLNNLAAVLINEGKAAEAEPMVREALAIQRHLLKSDHEDIAGSLLNLAAALAGENKLPDAETAQREALSMQERLLGEHLDVATSCYNLAFLLEADGKYHEAETNAERALALRQKLLTNEHYFVATTMALLARIRGEQHNLEGAEGLQRREVAMWRNLLKENSTHLPVNVMWFADSLARLTKTLVARQNYAAADPFAHEAVAFTDKELPKDWQSFRARSLLGEVLTGEHKLVEAEPLLLQGYEGLARSENVPADNKTAVAEAIQRLVSYYQAVNRPEKAGEWKKKLDTGR